MNEPRVLVDGRAQTDVAADDRGLAYGDGVFRTMRADAGRIEAWSFQYARLAADCRALSITPPTVDALACWIDRLLAQQPEAIIKTIVTRGSGGRGYTPPDDAAPRCIVSIHGLPVCPPDELTLAFAETRLGEQALLAGIKHLNRLEQVWARRECVKRQMPDLVMCDAQDRVIATTMRNLLFAAPDGQWYSPALTRCGIAGATRERLCRERARAAAPVAMIDISHGELGQFCAAVACNSVQGVVPVHAIGPQTFTHSASMADLCRTYLSATA